MKDFNKNDTVWIVSFEVDQKGKFLDYAVEEFDLREHPRAVEKLESLVGKGVFSSAEEAERWAKKQFAEPNHGCGGGCGCGGGGGCCHQEKGRLASEELKW